MNEEPKRPDFIILDSEIKDEPSFDQLRMLPKLAASGIMRFAFLVISALSVFWFGGAVICWAFSSLFYLLSGNKSDKFEGWMWDFWLAMQRSAVFATGLFTAIFSPSLGLGFILLFLILREDKGLNYFQSIVSRFAKRP